MQMSIKNFYAYRSRENNSNKLLANDSNFAAGAVCAGAVCAGACVQVRVIFAATLHQRSNFTAALHLLCGNLVTSRQPTGQLRSTEFHRDFATSFVCISCRDLIHGDGKNRWRRRCRWRCGRRRRFISQIRFVARNNDSSTSNLGFCTMNARTFFFFFSTTRIATLQRHLSLIFGWTFSLNGRGDEQSLSTMATASTVVALSRREPRFLRRGRSTTTTTRTFSFSRREQQCRSDNFSHRWNCKYMIIRRHLSFCLKYLEDGVFSVDAMSTRCRRAQRKVDALNAMSTHSTWRRRT